MLHPGLIMLSCLEPSPCLDPSSGDVWVFIWGASLLTTALDISINLLIVREIALFSFSNIAAVFLPGYCEIASESWGVFVSF